MIKVSVAMITYNHERFIEEALCSVLKQTVNFQYEIVIGEDCSTDNTRQIIRNFQKQYPNIIKPLFYEKNKGMFGNIREVMKNCSGEYIAFLEGDDFWTNSTKLQKQVDFLDSHKEYSLVAHECSMVNLDGEEIEKICKVHEAGLREYRVENIEANELPGQTLTIMLRNCQPIIKTFFGRHRLDKKLPLDRILPILALSVGRIAILPDNMGAYRFYMEQGGDNWSSKYDKRSPNCNYILFYYLACKTEYIGRKYRVSVNMMNEKVNLFFEAIHTGYSKHKLQGIIMILLEAKKLSYWRAIMKEHRRRKMLYEMKKGNR